MSRRVEGALEATGLSIKYSDRLRRAGITDAAVDICLKKSYKNVAQLLSCVEDYNLFIQAYLEQNRDNPEPEPGVRKVEGQVGENLVCDQEIQIQHNSAQNPAIRLSGSEDTEMMQTQNSSGNFLPDPDPDKTPDQINFDKNETEANSIVHECYNVYAKQVQQLSVVPSESQINSFLLDEELQKIHEISKSSALELFHGKIASLIISTQASQEFPFSEEAINKSKKELVKRIQQLHQIIISLNSDACQSAIQVATGELEIYLSSAIIQDTNSDSVWYPDPDPDLDPVPSPSGEFKDLVDDPDDLEFVIVPKSDSSRSAIKTVKECEPIALSFFQKLLCLDNLDSCPAAKQAFEDVIKVFKKNQGEPPGAGVDDQPEAESVIKTEEINNMHQAWTQYWLEITQKIRNTNRYWTSEAIKEVQKLTMDEILQEFLMCSKHTTDNENHAELKLSDVRSKFLGFKLVDSENNNRVQMQSETEFRKAVDDSNSKYLASCRELIHELVHIYSELLEETWKSWPNGVITQTTQEARVNFSRILKFSDGFESLPDPESEGFVAELSSRMDDSCERIVDKWYWRKRQMLLRNYRDGVTSSLYGGNSCSDNDTTTTTEATFVDAMQKLNEVHLERKAEAVNAFNEFLSSIPVLPFKDARCIETKNADLIDGAVPEEIPDLAKFFDKEIETIKDALIENLKFREDALHENVDGYLAHAKLKYKELVRKINQALHNEETYLNWSSAAKEEVKRSFQDQCRKKLVALTRIDSQLLDLDTFMESVPQIKIVDETAIQLSAPSLSFSRDLGSFCAKLQCCSELHSKITDVVLTASKEICIDENICGDFWSGKNLVLVTNKIIVAGNCKERVIDLSGKNGAPSASKEKPETPQKPGVNGLHGEDGDPGQNGGHFVILNEDCEIINPQNLCIISNGGSGGNGQPGGDGSPGENGLDGNLRFQMTAEDLKSKFPSPAVFFGGQSSTNIQIGVKSLEEIAEANLQELKCLGGCKSESRCFEVETKEEAKIYYGFYQKTKMNNAIVAGRSFYVWCQGAPGTVGQSGGYGGRGGQGGQPGSPGIIKIPAKYENENDNISTISVLRKEGMSGVSRCKGKNGKQGLDGLPGTDYALLDPYVGLGLGINLNSNSARTFSGCLKMEVVDATNTKLVAEAAFCPHRRKHITFLQVPVNELQERGKAIPHTRHEIPLTEPSLVAQITKVDTKDAVVALKHLEIKYAKYLM